MATRAKSKRKSAGKSKGRGRSTRAATSKTSAKRAASSKRAAAAKRGATPKRRATTKGRAAPKRRASPKRRATSGRRAGISQRSRSALAKTARMMSQDISEQKVSGDAIALLEQDHREVEALYEQFEEAESSTEKSGIAWKICVALTVHAAIEEEIFYPMARKSIDKSELLDEAEVEHASAKQLIAEIEEMAPREKLFDAKVKVLVEYVKHHVKEEETELFPAVRQSGLDLYDLGGQLAERKIELLQELSGR